jgi:flagellar hook-associated protein 2
LGLSSYDKPAIEQLKSYKTYTDADVNAEMQRRAQAGADAYKELFNSQKAAEKNYNDLVEQRNKMDEEGSEATEEQKAELDEKIAEADAKKNELATQVADAEASKIWSGDIEYEYDAENNITGIASISNVAVDSGSASSLEAQIRGEFDDRAAYATSQLAAIEAGTLTGAATKVVGQDAIIELNDAKFESSNNVFDINGLTITALAETAKNESVTLTTSNDTSGIYDQIKNFINTYNNIINELDKLYNAESSSKYTPLTDEEKEALSDTEVEKYETKIKDGLFKSDETISNIMSSLTSGMAQGFKIGDKTYHLSDFGINTLSYFEAEKNETHAFHIDGDEKDEKTSGKTDKLKGLIASDPESVSNFFTKLTNDIYQRLDKLSSRKPGRRTYGTFYEDQVMKEDNKNYDSKISELEEKANKYEDNLYAKFSKMEATMAKLQSKTSALSGMFGGGG